MSAKSKGVSAKRLRSDWGALRPQNPQTPSALKLPSAVRFYPAGLPALDALPIADPRRRRLGNEFAQSALRGLTRASLSAMGGYLRHASPVDPDPRQNPPFAHALAESLLACHALCDGARPDHIAHPLLLEGKRSYEIRQPVRFTLC